MIKYERYLALIKCRQTYILIYANNEMQHLCDVFPILADPNTLSHSMFVVTIYQFEHLDIAQL